jgi:hypothetical protein
MKVNIVYLLIVFTFFLFCGCPGMQAKNDGHNDTNHETPDEQINIEQVNYYQPPVNVSGTIYDIGPGYTYPEIQDFPWLNLKSGDLVRIHYRSTPYNGIIGINAHGTKDAPVRIYGICDGDGRIPIISGENAVIGTGLNGYFDVYTMGLGLIVINDTWHNKPTYIEIANLDIRDANSPNRFADNNTGIIHNWDRPEGIWLKAGNVSVLGCRIHNNGEGILTQANDSSIEGITSDFFLEGSSIYDNGVVGSWFQHNLYIQSAGMTVQFCKIGTLKSGAEGSALKDRSSGTIIRYNYIESGARTLDLVEPEDSEAVLLPRSDFNVTYVYGNILVNDCSDPEKEFSGNMIHYGYDNSESISRNGTLFFYNNTVYINAMIGVAYRINVFDISLNTAKAYLYNNIIHRSGDSNLNLMFGFGNVYASGGNWITDGWYDIHEGVPYQDPDPAVARIIYGTLVQTVNFSEGADPGLRNFSLVPGSSCLNTAVTLPANLSSFPVIYQFNEGKINTPRTLHNNPGAVE